MTRNLSLRRTRNRHPSSEDVLKGFVAGMIAGLVGTAAKSLAEVISPVSREVAIKPRVRAADAISEEFTGEHLDEEQEATADQLIHWTFGTLVGGVYGAVTELAPPSQAGIGLPFGTALWTMTHESMLPLLNLAPPPSRQPLQRQASELTTHLVYGATVEIVRRIVRRML